MPCKASGPAQRHAPPHPAGISQLNNACCRIVQRTDNLNTVRRASSAGLMEQAGASAGVPVEGRKQSPTDLAFQVGSTRKRASDLPTTLSSSYNGQALMCSEGAHSSEIGCCHYRALAALTPWWRSMASHPRAPRRISTLRRWPVCSSRARLSSSSIEVRAWTPPLLSCLPAMLEALDSGFVVAMTHSSMPCQWMVCNNDEQLVRQSAQMHLAPCSDGAGACSSRAAACRQPLQPHW